MKKLIEIKAGHQMIKITTSVLFIYILSFTSLMAQPGKPGAGSIWAAASSPSKTHKLFGSYEGKWQSEIKDYVLKDKNPFLSILSANIEMTEEGRFMNIKLTGSRLDNNFQETFIFGYNNGSKEITAVVFSTFGTETRIFRGKWMREDEFAELAGEYFNADSKRNTSAKISITFLSKNNLLIEYSELDENGISIKKSEYNFTRKK